MTKRKRRSRDGFTQTNVAALSGRLKAKGGMSNLERAYGAQMAAKVREAGIRVTDAIRHTEGPVLTVADHVVEDARLVILAYLGQDRLAEFDAALEQVREGMDAGLDDAEQERRGSSAIRVLNDAFVEGNLDRVSGEVALGVDYESAEMREAVRALVESQVRPEMERIREQYGDETPDVRVETGEDGSVQILIGENPSEVVDHFQVKANDAQALVGDRPLIEDPWERLVLAAVAGDIDPEEFSERIAQFVGDDPEKLTHLRAALDKSRADGDDSAVHKLLGDAYTYVLDQSQMSRAQVERARERVGDLEAQADAIEAMRDPLWRFRRSERLALVALGVLEDAQAHEPWTGLA